MNEIHAIKVVSTRKLTASILELEFEGSIKPLPTWEPGSHIDLHLPNGLVRQYSLMESEVSKTRWRIAVSIEENGRGASKYIAENVVVGQLLTVGHPRNHFPFEESPEVVFIGAGIGVTPLLAMASAAKALGLDWKFHYLGKNRGDMPYIDEVIEQFGNRLKLNISDEGTRLNVPELLSNDSENLHYYACGPEQLLKELEVNISDSQRLHLERFTPKIQVHEPNKSFRVVAKKSGIEFEVPEDESILLAADFEGIEVQADCQEGTCGSCETRIIDGIVDHRDSILTEKQRKENQIMMICVSRAKGNTLVLEL